jgi:lysophospholipase L1-like esterase
MADVAIQNITVDNTPAGTWRVLYVDDATGTPLARLINGTSLLSAIGGAVAGPQGFITPAPAIDGNTSPVWYRPWGEFTTTGSASPVGTRSHLVPIQLPPGQIRHVAFNVVSTTAGTGSWARVALYNLDVVAGVVGSLVAAGDPVDLTTAGVKVSTLAAPTTIAGGMYLAALGEVVTSGSAVLSSMFPLFPLPLGSAALAFAPSDGALITTTAPFAAPDPFGTTALFSTQFQRVAAVSMATPSTLPASAGSAVLLGDSLFARFAEWFRAGNATAGYRLRPARNEGVGSEELDAMLTRWATAVTPYDPDWVVLHGGVNDIVGFSRSAAVVQARYQALIDRAAIAGVGLIICTPPSSQAITAPQIAVLTAVRSWLLALSVPNVVVADTGMALTTGDGTTADATKLVDNVHPNAAGITAMAAVVASRLASI